MKGRLVASVGLNVLLVVAMVAAAIVLPTQVLASNAERRSTQFEAAGKQRGGIVFLGDSITRGGPWSELFGRSDVHNRGIGGDTTQDILDRVDAIHALAPRKLFLMIGINDLFRGVPRDATSLNLDRIFDGFDREIPQTQIYLQSVLPVNEGWPRKPDPADIDAINQKLRAEARERGYRFVDLRPVFSDADGSLKRVYTKDGVHLLAAGYVAWRDAIATLVRE